ncbi:B12-binding domain-containing radical SAM protein [bacterium]|nr:B12-binding domain-containing radical SAM protein [candidate division CSSED10-310 bacterium]
MARVLFLQNIWTENLGPMYLSSAVTKEGHECKLIIESNRKENREIIDFKPDIIAFSCATGTHRWAQKRASELKSLCNVPIILGGSHATYYPEVIESESIDIICRGEGEKTFIDLLNHIDKNADYTSIPNLWMKINGRIIKNELRNLIEDLDSLPPPDRDLYYRYDYLKNNENKSFISGRGCPYSCRYCSIAGLREMYKGKGCFVRFHSPERVIEDIETVRKKYGVKTVIFQDDTFIIGEERLFKLLSMYAQKLRLPFVCHVRADVLTTDIAKALKDAGCHSVDFGLESGDEGLRQRVLGKNVTDEHIIHAASVLHSAGIRFRTTNMFGLPGETIQQAWKTVTLNQKISTDFPSASVYQPYPRTALGDQVIREGLVGKDYGVNSIGTSFFRSSILTQSDQRSFVNLQKFFWPAVRFPKLKRLIAFLIKLPPNPIYEAVFLFFYGINYALSEKISLKRVVNIGIHTARSLFFSKTG